MATTPPASIAGYFSRDRDVDTMLEPFAENALVKDEGHEHRGRTSIRRWIQESNEKYAPVVEVLESTTRGDQVVVLARVSGTFEGSPITLRYTFTLENERVVELVIAS